MSAIAAVDVRRRGPSVGLRSPIGTRVLLSRKGVQGLILPGYHDDGCGCSRDVSVLPNVASGGGTPRRKTALPGPSSAGEWMLSVSEDSLTNQENFFRLEASDTTAWQHPPTSTRRTTETSASFPDASITLP
jgi:hypothetical protein